jgi:hypothetical protein
LRQYTFLFFSPYIIFAKILIKIKLYFYRGDILFKQAENFIFRRVKKNERKRQIEINSSFLLFAAAFLKSSKVVD